MVKKSPIHPINDFENRLLALTNEIGRFRFNENRENKIGDNDILHFIVYWKFCWEKSVEFYDQKCDRIEW